MLLTFQDVTDRAWLEYPPLERALQTYNDMMAHHYDRCGGAAALGGASRAQFAWALSIVGSRCLGVSMLLLALLSANKSGAAERRGPPSDLQEQRPGTPVPQRRKEHSGWRRSALRQAAAADVHSTADVHEPYRATGGTAEASARNGDDSDDPADSVAGASAAALMLMLLQAAGSSGPSPSFAVQSSASGSEAVPPGATPSSDSRRQGPNDKAIAGEGATKGSPDCDQSVTGDAPRAQGSVASGPRPELMLPVAGGQLRMLVPLLDLINHRMARRTGGRLGGGGPERLVSGPNVRWELRAPPPADHNPSVALSGNTSDTPPSTTRTRSASPACSNPADGASQIPHEVPQPSPAQSPTRPPPPDEGPLSGWRVAVVATADLSPGEELFLCYDEGASNDAFALHYGFVPPLNPNDDVQLYDSLEEALAWHRCEVQADGALARGGLTEGVLSASVGGQELTAMELTPLAPHLRDLGRGELDRLYAEALEAGLGADGSQCSDDRDTSRPVKLGPGGRLCPRLLAALSHLAPQRNHPHQADSIAVAVARRCAQLLRARSPLVTDLELLMAEHLHQERQQQGPSQADLWASLESHAQPDARGGPTEAIDTTLLQSGHADGGRQDAGGGGDGLSEASIWRGVLQGYQEALARQAPALRALAGLGSMGAPIAAAAKGCHEPHEDGSGALSCSRGPGTADGGLGLGSASGRQGSSGGLLTPSQRLALTYRVHKKLLLWDYFLDHGPACG